MNTLPVPPLDPGTLLFSISVLGFLLAAIAWSSAASMLGQRRAMLDWSKAMAAAGGAFLLYYLRGHAPSWLTFLLANVLVLTTVCFVHDAFRRLLGLRLRHGWQFGVSALAMSGVLFTYFAAVSRMVAVFTMSCGAAVVLAVTAHMLLRNPRARRTPSAVIAGLVTALLACTLIVRAVVSSLGHADLLTHGAGSVAQLSVLLSGALYVIATSVGFFTLTLACQNDSIVENARRDGLTGVYTRSAFFDLAQAVQPGASDHAYAIVMLDIDHFKGINDRYGHGGGDVVLTHAARMIAGAVRATDIVGRYGGEEFSILLSQCNEHQAADLAERLVSEARQQSVRLPDGRTARYTVSAGYAVQQDASDPQAPREPLHAVIERADQALYGAKRAGRDRAQGALRAAPAPTCTDGPAQA